MNSEKRKDNLATKNKAPNFLVNFYGIMAVLFVLIPEWIAEIGLTLDNSGFKNELPKYKYNSLKDKYLYISSLEIKELRYIASKLRIIGYSNENKRSIKKRILRVLKQKELIEFIKESLRWKNLC
tara:strand:+ start:205 stop:579 length:375 start_codon:yes stop_codon:yes gene_type:complete